MDRFYLSPQALHEILVAKKIKSLFHANTVLTSLTFISQGALLSRESVTKKGLPQSPQKSDDKDQKYSVWDDVFFDALDLHKKYKDANKYGPVLFALNIDLLLAPGVPKLLITRKNPYHWLDGDVWGDRYYEDVNAIEADYNTGKRLDAQIMFTLRSPNQFVDLGKFLRGILLDRPNIIIKAKGADKNLGEHAFEKLRGALDANNLSNIPIYFRHQEGVNVHCGCGIAYNHLLKYEVAEFLRRWRTVPT